MDSKMNNTYWIFNNTERPVDTGISHRFVVIEKQIPGYEIVMTEVELMAHH